MSKKILALFLGFLIGCGIANAGSSGKIVDSGTEDHGELTGLEDNDHPQYSSVLEYNPDKAPTSGLDTNCSDEFANGVSTGTWRSGNFGTSTHTLGAGSAFLTADGNASQKRVRWCTPPAGSFVYTVKMSHTYDGGTLTRQRCGLSQLRTGTEATPTLIDSIFTDFASSTNSTVQWGTDDNYDDAAGGAAVSIYFANGADAQTSAGFGHCFQMRYNATADTLTGCYAADCINWRCGSVGSVTSDPISLGYFSIQTSTCAVYWTRLCTSGPCMSFPFPAGS
jgi:hypothetical protein